MDAKQELLTKDTIDSGYKFITSSLSDNRIMEEILSVETLDEQKKILSNYLKGTNLEHEDKMIELSEVMLFMIEKSTIQKSMMLGRIKDDTKIVRTKHGLKIFNSENKFVTVPYSRITSEIIGKELAKKIRKVI